MRGQTVKLHRSRYGILCYSILYAITLLLVGFQYVYYHLPIIPAFLILSLLIVSYYQLLIKQLLRNHTKSIVAISWNDHAKAWCVHTRDGQQYDIQLLNHSILSRVVILLNFKRRNRWFSSATIVFNDALRKDDLLQLRRSLQCWRQSQLGKE